MSNPQKGVTWGTNQVHTFSSGSSSSSAPATGGFNFIPQGPSTTPAPAPFGSPAPTAFGSPAPAPSGGGGGGGGGGGFFGSGGGSTTSSGIPAPAGGGLFGSTTPAPAPTGGGLFGATNPAPATGGSGFFGAPAAAPPGGSSLFGATAPSSGGSLFGAAPAPSGGSSLFGSTAPNSTGFFGAPASNTGGTMFGAPASNTGSTMFGAPAPSSDPQVAAYAVIQAHQNAQAQRVYNEFKNSLDAISFAYQGIMAAPSETESAPFSAIVYSPASSDYQRCVWMARGNTGNNRIKPILPQPQHVSVKEWELACLRAPEDYEPVSICGATALETRLSWQESFARENLDQIKTLREFQKTLEERKEQAWRQGLLIKQDRLRKERKQRLWRIMQKVELLRAYQQPLTHDERLSIQHTAHMIKQTDALEKQVQPRPPVNKGMPRLAMPDGQTPVDPKVVLQALEHHHLALHEIMDKVKKDLRDLKLLNEHLNK